MRGHVHCTQRSFTSFTALSEIFVAACIFLSFPNQSANFAHWHKPATHPQSNGKITKAIKFGQYERKRAQVQWPTPELLILDTDRIININQSVLSCVFDLYWKRFTVDFYFHFIVSFIHSFVVRRTNASHARQYEFSHIYIHRVDQLSIQLFLLPLASSTLLIFIFKSNHWTTHMHTRSLSTWRNVDTWKIKFSTCNVHVSLFIFMR